MHSCIDSYLDHLFLASLGLGSTFPLGHFLLNEYIQRVGEEPIPFTMLDLQIAGAFTVFNLFFGGIGYLVRNFEEEKIYQQQKNEAIGYVKEGDPQRAVLLSPRRRDKNQDIEIRFIGTYQRSREGYATSREWKRLIDDLPEENFPFRDIPGSRNKVYVFDGSSLDELIVIKRGRSVEIGYRVLRHVNDHLAENRSTVVPLGFYKEDDEEVIITAMSKSLTLEEYLEGKNATVRETEAKKSMVTLARLHSVTPDLAIEPNQFDLFWGEFKETLKEYDPSTEIRRRLVQRLNSSSKVVPFLRAYHQFMARFDLQPDTLVHGDCYPTNVFQGGILFDFEKAGISQEGLDLSILYSPQFADLDHQKLLKVYCTERSSREQRDVYVRNFEFWAIHRTLCEAGSFLRQGRDDVAMHFILEGARVMQEVGCKDLRNTFLSYMESGIKV
jgi:hypothetical protein